MIYFTSDWHLGDPRLELINRDYWATDLDTINNLIITNFTTILQPDDVLYILGDIVFDSKYIPLIDEIPCKKHLVIGNYDEDKISMLAPHFDSIKSIMPFIVNNKLSFVAIHKPIDLVKLINKFNSNIDFGVVGHVHGLWRVKKTPIPMINVSVECWNFKPISIVRLLKVYNTIVKYYDENV